MHTLKTVLLVSTFIFSSALLDAQAKGGGVMGRGAGKAVNNGSGGGYLGRGYGNGNQQGKDNGQRLRNGSCESSRGLWKGSGRQMNNHGHGVHLKDGTSRRLELAGIRKRCKS